MRCKFFCLITFMALIFAVSSLSMVQADLIGYWSMEEGSGDQIADASGNGHNGTAQNTNWVDGKFGQALEFNGTDSVVDIPYFPEMAPVEGVTLAVWVFPTDTTRSCIVGQFEGYGMALESDLRLKSVIWGGDWVSTVAIPANEWSYVAMTWDVNNTHRMIFVNGEVVDEQDNMIAIPNVENNLGIGKWAANFGWEDMFMGIIDEVKFWDTVLAEAEVDQASQPAPVDPQDKLATVWGDVKSSR